MLKNYYFQLFYNKLLCLVSIRVRCEFNAFSATERLFLDFHWNIFRFVGRYLSSVLLKESQCFFCFLQFRSIVCRYPEERVYYYSKTYAFFITHRKKKRKKYQKPVIETFFFYFTYKTKRQTNVSGDGLYKRRIEEHTHSGIRTTNKIQYIHYNNIHIVLPRT